MKALKLPTLLEGKALAVWMELSEEEQKNYQRAKAQMTTIMAPVWFVSLENFQERWLHPGESLSLFLHVLKRLLDQVMPEADAATWKQLLLHQFFNRSHLTSRDTSVLPVSPARSSTAKLSRSEEVILMWSAWTPGKELPFRKRHRGTHVLGQGRSGRQ